MILNRLEKKSLIHPPRWLTNNTMYLTQMGSVAYGCNEDTSDVDVYGVCMPPKDIVFPHTAGIIPGFGRQIQRFEVWQQHHVLDKERKTEYDFSVYSIVKYFQLCMENNPNMIDSLFVPRRCIIHSTAISEHVRDNRKLFLHKGCYQKFKGYSYSQMHKIRNKTNVENHKRAEDIQKYGYSTKFAMHLVRLLNECEYILVNHDLDLEFNREQLKSIRRGEWTLDQVEEYFTMKERLLEELYVKSTLQNAPDEDCIKNILMQCLEMHYGSIDSMIYRKETPADLILDQLQNLIERYRQ
jgi:predicted nucleotidyltransferase